MSAYALPGLFPPISDSTDSVADSNATTNARFQSPLHQQNEASSFAGLLRASVDLLSVPSFTSSGGRKGDSFGSSLTKSSSSGDTISDEPGIAVKEAKIDPLRLIQIVTGSTSRSYSQVRKSLRRRGSRERLAESTSPHSSPVNRKLTMNVGEEDIQQPSNTSTSKRIPHDEAIEFELSISFNGRKYTATRTLQCIMQLRDDLIREMNARSQWLQIRQAASDSFSTVETRSESHEIGYRTNTQGQIRIEIPEIPAMTCEESSGSSGFVGRGFTMLHAMATSYVPVMERWLRNVMVIVPQDSECLTNFLWEPLSNEDFPPDLPSKSCNSLATLGSIKELDYNTEDDDDSDDDEDDTW